MSDEPYVTQTGKVLSDEEIEGYVQEAEAGYVVPEMYRWDVAQKFVLTRGEFDLNAERALYEQGVRRETHPGNFRYAYTVGAPTAVTAQAIAQTRLFDKLRPYGVEAFVFDVRVVCLGVPQ